MVIIRGRREEASLAQSVRTFATKKKQKNLKYNCYFFFNNKKKRLSNFNLFYSLQGINKLRYYE